MSDANRAGELPLRQLILVPALITLGITLLRLTGELLEWSPALFNRQGGGFLSIVGIVWLVPVFGIYFAVKLVRAGHSPDSLGRTFGVAFLSLAIIPFSLWVVRTLHFAPGGRRFPLLIGVLAIVSLLVGLRAWPALGRVLFAYGLSARIPVAVVMLVAILAGWGTHYEKGPPGFPPMHPLATWFWIGLLPQLTIWIAFTVILGTIFGALAALAVGRRAQPAAA
ncbi:MAG TPA: hypothetical protein VN461_06385 [Vicinamibacteria bacterium]|nr:hypothetical protein [Vicinamibacteria bacterium]